jgi:DNA-binding transcriptional regulator YiaG
MIQAEMPREVAPVVRKLKIWRADNNLSQSQAVRALVDAGLPVKLRTLQQWEIASSAPHPVTAAALERFLVEQKKSEVSPLQKKVAPIIERLKAWRAANNLSQSQAVQILLAVGLPAKVRTLQAWEVGRHSPQAITAAALERFLDENPKVDQLPR